MTYADFFADFKQKFEGADVSDITDHLAYQFNIEDDQVGGAFYVEVKEGQLHIEPYEYYDRDVAFTCKPDVLNKIVSGELDPVWAYTTRKLKVDGSIDKALRLKDLIEKKKQKDSRKNKKEDKAEKKAETKKEAEVKKETETKKEAEVKKETETKKEVEAKKEAETKKETETKKEADTKEAKAKKK